MLLPPPPPTLPTTALERTFKRPSRPASFVSTYHGHHLKGYAECKGNIVNVERTKRERSYGNQINTNRQFVAYLRGILARKPRETSQEEEDGEEKGLARAEGYYPVPPPQRYNYSTHVIREEGSQAESRVCAKGGGVGILVNDGEGNHWLSMEGVQPAWVGGHGGGLGMKGTPMLLEMGSWLGLG